MRARSLETLRKDLGNCKAVSPAISMVIITAVTVTLVLVAWFYAGQVLAYQQAGAEFENIKSSLIAYDDAVRAVAWNINASRSVEFKMSYGNLQFIPNALSLQVNARIGDQNTFSKTIETGIFRYSTSTTYVTFGNGYQSYLLGDSDQTSFSNESCAQALVTQDPRFVNVTLQYRVRVTAEGQPILVQGKLLTYVDILLIRPTAAKSLVGIGDFQLVARNQALNVYPSEVYNVNSGGCTVSVTLDGSTSIANVALPAGTETVMFNLIVGDVYVST